MPARREWPVVLRPRTGELLSSWIVRVAGVYHLDALTLAVEHLGWPADVLMEIDLSPPERIVQEFSQLARLSQDAVERHTIGRANPDWIPDWITLETPCWNTTDFRVVFPSGVLFNVCPVCLHEDLNEGGQFIRMSWLCATTTICNKHFIPLQACPNSVNPPFECRHGLIGARFFCRANRRVLDSPFYARQSSDMLVLLSEFEQKVKWALTASSRLARPTHNASADEQLISVVEDLTWALLQVMSVDGSRIVHYFQTDPFPVPPGWRRPLVVDTLSRVDVDLRRSILAVVACLLEPSQFADLARTTPHLCLPSRYSRLLQLLGALRTDWFLSGAHRWPAAFRERMERVA
jgi:TniQ